MSNNQNTKVKITTFPKMDQGLTHPDRLAVRTVDLAGLGLMLPMQFPELGKGHACACTIDTQLQQP